MAISFDRATESGGGVGSSATFSHTTSGTNRMLFVGLSINTSRTVSSVTYGGVAMTKINTQSSGGITCELWYLINPTVGANNVVATFSGSGTYDVIAASYAGVRQSNQPDGQSANNTSGTSIANTITSTRDLCWHCAYACGSGATSAGASTTERSGSGFSYGFFDSNAAITPAGSNTLNIDHYPTGTVFANGATFSPYAIEVDITDTASATDTISYIRQIVKALTETVTVTQLNILALTETVTSSDSYLRLKRKWQNLTKNISTWINQDKS